RRWWRPRRSRTFPRFDPEGSGFLSSGVRTTPIRPAAGSTRAASNTAPADTEGFRHRRRPSPAGATRSAVGWGRWPRRPRSPRPAGGRSPGPTRARPRRSLGGRLALDLSQQVFAAEHPAKHLPGHVMGQLVHHLDVLGPLEPGQVAVEETKDLLGRDAPVL